MDMDFVKKELKALQKLDEEKIDLINLKEKQRNQLMQEISQLAQETIGIKGQIKAHQKIIHHAISQGKTPPQEKTPQEKTPPPENKK